MANELAKRQNTQTSLLPANLTGAMELAKMMAESTLVPLPLQKKPADCLLVIEQAMRWGMSPFAVAQSTSVIHGKLMFEGKLVAAVVNANGDLEKRLSYAYTGEGDLRKLTVSGSVKGEPAARTIDVVLKDVRTTNEQWKKQPDQQLMYAGARIWARRHMPELMLGVYTPEEEIEDVRPTIEDAVPIVAVSSPIIEAPIAPAEAPAVVVEKDDPRMIPVSPSADGSTTDWMNWGKTYSEALRNSTTPQEFETWIKLNALGMNSISKGAPHLHSRLMDIIESERKRINVEAAPAAEEG